MCSSLLDSCSSFSKTLAQEGVIPGHGSAVFWIPAHPVGREWTDVCSRNRLAGEGDFRGPGCPLLRERLRADGILNFMILPPSP